MTAIALLTELQEAGIRVCALGDRLHIEAKPGTVTADLRARLVASKAELLMALKPGSVQAQLLSLATDEQLPLGLVFALSPDDLTACEGMPDEELRAYLHALAGRERMDAGLPPLAWGEPAARWCEGCGAVELWADCPAMVKACPWCWNRKAHKPITRPLLSCTDCLHLVSSQAGGEAVCAIGHGSDHPERPRRCADWHFSQSEGDSHE